MRFYIDKWETFFKIFPHLEKSKKKKTYGDPIIQPDVMKFPFGPPGPDHTGLLLFPFVSNEENEKKKC